MLRLCTHPGGQYGEQSVYPKETGMQPVMRTIAMCVLRAACCSVVLSSPFKVPRHWAVTLELWGLQRHRAVPTRPKS